MKDVTTKKTNSTKKIIIAGAGSAGLNLAAELAKQGHQVMLFETKSEKGLRNGYTWSDAVETASLPLAGTIGNASDCSISALWDYAYRWFTGRGSHYAGYVRQMLDEKAAMKERLDYLAHPSHTFVRYMKYPKRWNPEAFCEWMKVSWK